MMLEFISTKLPAPLRNGMLRVVTETPF